MNLLQTLLIVLLFSEAQTFSDFRQDDRSDTQSKKRKERPSDSESPCKRLKSDIQTKENKKILDWKEICNDSQKEVMTFLSAEELRAMGKTAQKEYKNSKETEKNRQDNLDKLRPMPLEEIKQSIRIHTVHAQDIDAFIQWLKQHKNNHVAYNFKLNGFSDDDIKKLLPHLDGSRFIDLSDSYIGDEGVKALAASKSLQKLTYLNLSNNIGDEGIGDEGAKAIAASPYLQNLTALYLSGGSIGDGGIGDKGVKALAASKNLQKLTTLYLAMNLIGDEGAKAIAASENLQKLTTLYLALNFIGDEGVEALATSKNLQSLTALYLQDNRIGDKGKTALEKLKSDKAIDIIY